MGSPKTLLLGFIAGVTILLGLPVGRMRRPAPSLRALLNAVAVGILLFLVWDVLSHGWEPIDTALGNLHDHRGGLAPVLGYGTLFAGGFAVGLLSLVFYERWMGRISSSDKILAPPATNFGPGAMTVGEQVAAPRRIASWSPARRLALLIAVGIGLHNFAEGLAIGQSAARGEVALATLLVIGFGLHNATEGLGIVAPPAADVTDGAGDALASRPGWGFLLILGVIGGEPRLSPRWPTRTPTRPPMVHTTSKSAESGASPHRPAVRIALTRRVADKSVGGVRHDEVIVPVEITRPPPGSTTGGQPRTTPARTHAAGWLSRR